MFISGSAASESRGDGGSRQNCATESQGLHNSCNKASADINTLHSVIQYLKITSGCLVEIFHSYEHKVSTK